MEKQNERLEYLLQLAREVVEQAENNAKVNPKTDEIQVVVVEPEKKPYKKTIKNDLDAMKEIVGGWIENVFIDETEKGGRVAITLNEEGKLIGLPFNKVLVAKGGKDLLVGNLFITAYNMEGDAISLTDDECEKYIRQFRFTEVYV